MGAAIRLLPAVVTVVLVLAAADASPSGAAKASTKAKSAKKVPTERTPEDAYRVGAVHYNSANYADALVYFRHCLSLLKKGKHEEVKALQKTLETLIQSAESKLQLQKINPESTSTPASSSESLARASEVKQKRSRAVMQFKKLTPKEMLKPNDTFFANVPNPKLLRVYVTPLLNASDCEWIVKTAEELGDWQPRLNYNTREIQIESLPELLEWARSLGGSITGLLRRQFGLTRESDLTLMNSNIIRYDASSNDTNHVLVHMDGSTMVTFNVLLSNPKDFEGGGTGMVHLNRTIFAEQGDMITYYSNAYHSGEPITRGRRYIWQGFIKVSRATNPSLDELVSMPDGVDKQSRPESEPGSPASGVPSVKNLKRTDPSQEEVLPSEDAMHLVFARKALSVFPELADANYNAGNLFRKFGRLEESAATLERALRVGHSIPEYVLAQLGETHRERGDYSAAARSFQRAIAIAPHDGRITDLYHRMLKQQAADRRKQSK